MKIKVCGMKHNIAEVAGLHPDYLGFIFWEGSPRYFDGDLPPLPASIKKVGVFVDAPQATILEKVRRYRLQLIQLHGNESPEFCNALRTALKASAKGTGRIGIIKVFSIKGPFDFKRLQPYETACDYFLFDTKGALPGGNGFAFDWRLLEGYPSHKPYFLSGGIGPDELPQLRDFMQGPEARYCHAVDVNSRFETEPGKKKAGSLTRFIEGVLQEDH